MTVGVEVRLFSRSGCHLCEEVAQLLESMVREHGHLLVVVDVDTDPVLASRYGERVPVIQVENVDYDPPIAWPSVRIALREVQVE